MNNYFAQPKQRCNKNCISCDRCMAADKRKVLQFRYNSTMQSSYTAQFDRRSANGSPVATSPRDKGLNRGTIRQEVKVPYSPPHHFDTIYTDQFADRKGTQEVGAMTKEGNSTQPTRKAPIGVLEGDRGDIKVRMASGTSNNLTY